MTGAPRQLPQAKLESVKRFILHQAQEIPAGTDLHRWLVHSLFRYGKGF